jgi:hypothetical protein
VGIERCSVAYRRTAELDRDRVTGLDIGCDAESSACAPADAAGVVDLDGGLPALITAAEAVVPVAEPTNPTPGRFTSIVICSPACWTKPSIATKSRSGKTTMLSGNVGTAADAAGAPIATDAARPTTTAPTSAVRRR